MSALSFIHEESAALVSSWTGLLTNRIKSCVCYAAMLEPLIARWCNLLLRTGRGKIGGSAMGGDWSGEAANWWVSGWIGGWGVAG